MQCENGAGTVVAMATASLLFHIPRHVLATSHGLFSLIPSTTTVPMQMTGNRRKCCYHPLLLLLHIHQLLAKCYYSFDSRLHRSGNFSSPKFPSEYPSGVLCQYVFHGEDFEGLKITFYVFELEPPYKTGCLSDYLDITTVNSRHERHLMGRFCGTNKPSPVLMMQAEAELVFRSNHAGQYKGFHAAYEFLHERDTPAPTPSSGRTNCGETLTGVGGVLTSPGYPDSIHDNLDCVWLIRVDSPRHVHVKVSELQFHGTIASCERMELSFYDGYSGFSQSARTITSLCGDLKYYRDIDDKSILSPRNRLIIRFQVTKGIHSKSTLISGFKLIWTEVNFVDPNQCQAFVCKQSNYCVRNSVKGSCSQNKQYCIDNSLVCDGVPNCSDNDNSDEDDCLSPYMVVVGGIAVIVGTVLLIIVVVVAIVVRRRTAVPKSTSQTQSLTMHLRQLDRSPSSSSRQIPNSYSQPCDLLTPTLQPEAMNGLAPYDAYGGGGDSISSRFRGLPTPV